MRKIVFASLAVLALTGSALARAPTRSENAKFRHDLNIVLDGARSGCIKRFGLYHPDETNTCIRYVSQRWFDDYRALHPAIDVNRTPSRY